MPVEDPLFPLLVYLFNEDGTYGEPIRINSEEQLRGVGTTLMLKIAIKQKREIVITDLCDLTVFHAKDGKILFAGGAQV